MLVITGCQRSGTMTAGRVFGVAHEVAFSPDRNPAWGRGRGPREVPKMTGRGESSWLAAPYVEQLLADSVTVLHLVRNPIAVIRSLVGIEFWAHAGYTRYREFIEAHLEPWIEVLEDRTDPVELSAWYWYFWNRPLSDLHLPRIRIEDVANAPTLNGRRRANLHAWSDLTDGPNVRRAKLLAESYGYQ